MHENAFARATALITGLAWAFVFACTEYFPDWLCNPYLSWPLLWIIALGLPLTLLFGIWIGLTQGALRLSSVLVLGAGGLFTMQVLLQGVYVQVVEEYNVFGIDVDALGSFSYRPLLDYAHSTEGDALGREYAASHLYSVYGFEVVWRNDAGELVVYKPSEEAHIALLETEDSETELLEARTQLRAISKRSRLHYTLSLAAFIGTFFPGLVIMAFLRRRRKDLAVVVP